MSLLSHRLGCIGIFESTDSGTEFPLFGIAEQVFSGNSSTQKKRDFNIIALPLSMQSIECVPVMLVSLVSQDRAYPCYHINFSLVGCFGFFEGLDLETESSLLISYFSASCVDAKKRDVIIIVLPLPMQGIECVLVMLASQNNHVLTTAVIVTVCISDIVRFTGPQTAKFRILNKKMQKQKPKRAQIPKRKQKVMQKKR